MGRGAPAGGVEGRVIDFHTHIETENQEVKVHTEAYAPVGGKAGGEVLEVEMGVGAIVSVGLFQGPDVADSIVV